MINEEIGYRSFLLRMWFGKHNEGRIWRASLENPRSGEQQIFSSLEDLCDFLRNLSENLERGGGEIKKLETKT